MFENPFSTTPIRRPEDTDHQANHAFVGRFLGPEMADAWDTFQEGSLAPSQKQEDDGLLDLTPEETKDIAEGRLEHLFHLDRQYARNKASLLATGLIETLPSGNEGIIGIDNKEYPFPTIEAIRNELATNRERYELKAKQGFTRLLIVPFASPIKQKFDAYQETLERHFKEGKLFAKGTKELPFSDKKASLGKMHIHPIYTDADTNGEMVYDPKQFTKEGHGGKTKRTILDEPSPFPGYRILLLEEDTTIPRQGTNDIRGGRRRIEAGLSPTRYREILKQPGYEHETPFTIDDWLTLSATTLEETNEVLDDLGNGKDSANWNGGSFFPNEGDSGLVSSAYWNRDGARAGVGRGAPTGVRSGGGFRPAVMGG